MDFKEILRALSDPFPESEIQWRAGATSGDKRRAQALPYADPRSYEDRLDEVLGAAGGWWECEFRPWGNEKIIAKVTLAVPAETVVNAPPVEAVPGLPPASSDFAGTIFQATYRLISRESTGEFDDGDRISHGPTAEAQAFKRACSKFGLGRYLYSIPIVWVEYDEQRRRLVQTPELPDRFLPGGGVDKSTGEIYRTEEMFEPSPAPDERRSGPIPDDGTYRNWTNVRDAKEWALSTGLFNAPAHVNASWEKFSEIATAKCADLMVEPGISKEQARALMYRLWYEKVRYKATNPEDMFDIAGIAEMIVLSEGEHEVRE